jgi:peptidyl-tRNA hydrolase, PTH1 family
MKLIVGLGNPGIEYTRTRHNAGFMVLERLAERAGLSLNSKPRGRFHASTLEGPVAAERCLLLQPMTFMNRSGLAVAEAVNFFKLDLKELLVVVDDVALPVGRLRLRPDGSDGGHNGLADIERALGSRAYPRLRIGIDPPGPVPQVDYVLGAFSPAQLRLLQPVLDTACDAIECWITRGVAIAMTRYNAAE